MQYKGKEITEEIFKKAQQCESAQELLKLAKENGIEMTAEEAEAFLDENADIELDEDTMKKKKMRFYRTPCHLHLTCRR